MMHTFYILAWFICSAADPCTKQPDPGVSVFFERKACLEAGDQLMKERGQDSWRFQYPLHYSCSQSPRWISKKEISTAASAVISTAVTDQFAPADVRAISTNAELRNGAKRKD